MRSWYAWLLSREPYIDGVDTVLIGIENIDSHKKAWHLCPYSNTNIKEAVSTKSMRYRIKVFDKLMSECAML